MKTDVVTPTITESDRAEQGRRGRDMAPVMLVESEKSVQLTLELGHIATCGPAGSTGTLKPPTMIRSRDR